jgi:hypothetical protein
VHRWLTPAMTGAPPSSTKSLAGVKPATRALASDH